MWGAIVYMIIAWLSDRLQRRYIFVMVFGSITALGYVLILCPISAGVQYFSTYLITTGMYIIAGINLSWTSLNSAPDGKRGATMGITLILTDLAGTSPVYSKKNNCQRLMIQLNDQALWWAKYTHQGTNQNTILEMAGLSAHWLSL